MIDDLRTYDHIGIITRLQLVNSNNVISYLFFLLFISGETHLVRQIGRHRLNHVNELVRLNFALSMNESVSVNNKSDYLLCSLVCL